MLRLSLMRRQTFQMLTKTVADRRLKCDADDLYRICALVTAANDPLHLNKDGKFMRGLKSLTLASGLTFTPFQKSVVDKALELAGADGDDDVDAAAGAVVMSGLHRDAGMDQETVQQQQQQQPQRKVVVVGEDIEELLVGIWTAVDRMQHGQYTASDERSVTTRVKELEPKVRSLTKGQFLSLAQALSRVNFKDYNFVMLLNRRAADLAREFSGSEAANTYANLTRLNSQDSLVAVVNCIERNVTQLSFIDVLRFVRALERRQQASAAPVTLIPKLAAHAVQFVADQGNAVQLLKPLLHALAAYKVRTSPAIAQIVSAAADHVAAVPDRDLSVMMQAITDLQLMTPKIFAAFIAHCTAVVSTMDIRSIDALIDVVSMSAHDSGAFMNAALDRIARDGKHLSPQQTVFLLDLLSSYPPAKSHSFAPELAVVCLNNSSALDAEQCPRILVSLAQLGVFTEAFFGLVDFTFASRRGLQSVEQLTELLGALTPKIVSSDDRTVTMVLTAIRELAPMLNDEDIVAIKKKLKELGINDRGINARIQGRQQTIMAEDFGGGGGAFGRGFSRGRGGGRGGSGRGGRGAW